MKNEEHAKMIVIEGLDKSGKTTQSRLLFDHLFNKYGKKIELLNFPDYSSRIGNEIKLFLSGHVNYSNEVQHLLLSANRWEKKNFIEELRKTKRFIIFNRYYQSNLAYGMAHGLDLEWLFNLEKGLPREDVSIILDIDPVVSQKRGLENRFKLDNFETDLTFLTKVRNNYIELAKRFNWNVINSDTNKENILHLILSIIRE